MFPVLSIGSLTTKPLTTPLRSPQKLENMKKGQSHLTVEKDSWRRSDQNYLREGVKESPRGGSGRRKAEERDSARAVWGKARRQGEERLL